MARYDRLFDGLFDFKDLLEVEEPESARSFEIAEPPDISGFEPSTLSDDEAFLALLEATRRSVEVSEESARMASASDKRSRIMLAVGIATLAVSVLALCFAVWSHFNPVAMPSSDAITTDIAMGSRYTQSDDPALPKATAQ